MYTLHNSIIDLFLVVGDMCNENAEFPELEAVPVVEKEPVPSFADQVSLLSMVTKVFLYKFDGHWMVKGTMHLPAVNPTISALDIGKCHSKNCEKKLPSSLPSLLGEEKDFLFNLFKIGVIYVKKFLN